MFFFFLLAMKQATFYFKTLILSIKKICVVENHNDELLSHFNVVEMVGTKVMDVFSFW